MWRHHIAKLWRLNGVLSSMWLSHPDTVRHQCSSGPNLSQTRYGVMPPSSTGSADDSCEHKNADLLSWTMSHRLCSQMTVQGQWGGKRNNYFFKCISTSLHVYSCNIQTHHRTTVGGLKVYTDLFSFKTLYYNNNNIILYTCIILVNSTVFVLKAVKRMETRRWHL